MGLYCGIDWATDHHDVAVVDDEGRVVARARVGNDAAGFWTRAYGLAPPAALVQTLAEAASRK